jgi:uncharacterized protein YigE (DUF2233 family)
VPRLSPAILFLLVVTAAHGEWKTISVQIEPSGAKGLEHRYVVAEDSATGERASLELAIFSSKSCTLRVVDQPQEPRIDLNQAMRREKCLAGVNGGYFDPDYRPIGLLIENAKVVAPLQRARLLSGILAASSTKVQILRVGEFSSRSNPSAAVECGPFLVDLGHSVAGLETTRSARRTFAAVARGDRAALGFCSEVSLADLSQVLAAGLGDFKIQRALNLDGGSSSAFWFKRKDDSVFSIREQKSVRDFVGIVAK